MAPKRKEQALKGTMSRRDRRAQVAVILNATRDLFGFGGI